MLARLRAFVRSLEIRLLVPLSITVAAVLAVHAILSYRSTKEHYLRFVDAEIDRSSGLIRRATHDGMLLNRLDEVQSTIERLVEEPDLSAIRVYDKDGGIVLSSSVAEIGRVINLESATCRTCHGAVGAGETSILQRRGLVPVAGGPDILRHLAVIENEPSCGTAACHYHPPEQRVLGILEVEMSMAPVDAALGAAQRQLSWTTVILIVICGAVAGVFIRRLVHNPVLRINEGTRRIAAGNLDTRIDVRGNHQLARLGEAFNLMVDDLRSARHELSEWSRTLEEKVDEKTKEVQAAQHEVMHMERMASLGKLSATVAHELNNPISGVLTYARLVRRELEDQALDDDVREELVRYLTLMEKECSRCGAIVHNMMTFARRTGAKMESIDLNEVLERSLMLVRHHLEISNVGLRTERLAGDSVIVADAGQIEQALVALLVNAVEAMGTNSECRAEITVRLSGSANNVEIVVADTGVGIDPDVLPHIFEPFFSTKGSESGVGLGLAVVYGIVRRHGGTIHVNSTPGRGTAFRLRLPRHPERQKDDETDACAPVPAIAASAGCRHRQETSR